jgi:hypothetical protein
MRERGLCEKDVKNTAKRWKPGKANPYGAKDFRVGGGERGGGEEKEKL